ncbi:TetR/AcrR family transcriptional regulator [Candidatus Uabimicrobium amorphum]|uniref:TetR family transcriptional regulator n=1 Tax=Uabimicrobium amorphum TaxID=2596890 RepID=A0A5S9ILN8_UABAM|nr:TetR/AcrR family transcriptional regulator [Candidatus Uabimicrobium amorphum]BBM83726.1 TetR family transcriptional regulator [Candidatus Uabimicrobium amorphum]
MAKELKRKQLLDAAASILTKNPGATMDKIATHAGVGRMTLYRYFPSREDLIRELTLESIKETNIAIQPIYDDGLSSEEALRKTLDNIIPLGDRFHFLIYESMHYKDREIEKAHEEQIEELYKFMEVLRKDDLISMDATWALYVFDALIWAAWSAIEEGDVARKKASGLVLQTFLSGLQTP